MTLFLPFNLLCRRILTVFPDRWFCRPDPVATCEKMQEITEGGSSISAGNFWNIFQCFFGEFLQKNGGIPMESTGENLKIFRLFLALSSRFPPYFFRVALSGKPRFLHVISDLGRIPRTEMYPRDVHSIELISIRLCPHYSCSVPGWISTCVMNDCCTPFAVFLLVFQVFLQFGNTLESE